MTEGNITIGGQTTTAAATGINTDANQAHRALTELPDLEQVLADQKAMQSAIGTVTNTITQVAADQASFAQKQLEAAEKEYKDSLTPEQLAAFNNLSTKEQQEALRVGSDSYNQAFTQVNDWSKGGDSRRALDAVSAAIASYGGGLSAGQLATNALAPYAASLIGDQFGHGENRNEALQLLSHAVLGAVLAQVNGGDATAGAVGAAGAELATNYLAKQLYPDAITANGDVDASVLTPEQRESLASLGAAIGAIGGGLTGNSLYDAAVGSHVGENAVVHNTLGEKKLDKYLSIAQKYPTLFKNGQWEGSQGQRELLQLFADNDYNRVQLTRLLGKSGKEPFTPEELNLIDRMRNSFGSSTHLANVTQEILSKAKGTLSAQDYKNLAENFRIFNNSDDVRALDVLYKLADAQRSNNNSQLISNKNWNDYIDSAQYAESIKLSG